MVSWGRLLWEAMFEKIRDTHQILLYGKAADGCQGLGRVQEIRPSGIVGGLADVMSRIDDFLLRHWKR
jgi:hypothetical protein